MKKCKLGDIITFQRGRDLPRDSMIDGPYPVVGSSGIIGYHNEYNVDPPCISVGRSGNTGTPFISLEKTWSHNTALYIKEFKNVDLIFTYYLLQTLNLSRYAGGSAVPTLNRNHVHTIPIKIPAEISNQRKIASFLYKLDELIQKNEQINDYLEELMLIEYDNLDKSEWEACTLSEYYEISIGRTPPRKETKWFSTNSSDVPWVSISDMGLNSRFISKTTEYLTEEAVNKFNIVVVPEGTIILSFKLTLGRVSVVGSDMCTNEAIAHLNTTDTYLLEFIYCLLKRYDYRLLGNTSSIGTAVNSKTIRLMPISLPSVEVIRKFHAKWSPLMETIRIIEHENVKLKTLRDFLLPRLIQGKIDIP